MLLASLVAVGLNWNNRLGFTEAETFWFVLTANGLMLDTDVVAADVGCALWEVVVLGGNVGEPN